METFALGAQPAPAHNGSAPLLTFKLAAVPRVLDDEPTDGAPLPLVTQRLFGFDFICDTNYDAVIERVLGPQPADGRVPMVVTPNVDDIVRLDEPHHREFRVMEQQARYVLPDGQPIVWTSHLARRPLAARLPGSTLFEALWARIVAEGRRTVVIANSEKVAAGLRAEYPDVIIHVPPMFDVDDLEARAAVVEQCTEVIRANEPEFVITGIGFPKQQHIAKGAIDALADGGERLPLFLLLGGSLNMHLGLTARAPQWIQRVGAEWLFRFAVEPRRLFRRYFVTDMKFLPMMVREVVTARNGRRTDIPTEARDNHPEGIGR